jgi:hypothetical protein
MPQRLLRPGIRQSKRWNRVGYFEQTLYIRIITLVDDFGRYESDPELLRSEAFPFGDPEGNPVTVPSIESALLTLASKDMIILYENGEKRYLQMSRWQERARSESRWPDPKNCKMLTNDSSCQQMKAPLALALALAPALAIRSNSVASLPGVCESIYAEYPKKVGKPDALKAIRKAISELSEAVILERTKAYAIARKGEDPKYTPHPSTWYNQQRFNDDPITWKNNSNEYFKPSSGPSLMSKEVDRVVREMNADVARESERDKADVPIDMSWISKAVKLPT